MAEPFEQQVAEALYAEGRGPLFDGPVAHTVCMVLAPRVAAAIERAILASRDDDQPRKVALAALRGGDA